MSIASRIESIEEHLRDDYSVLELAGADLTNVNKNIENLNSRWKERLLYFMNNGTEVVWKNWDKVVGEGTSLSLNRTLEAKMEIKIKPSELYQETTTGKNLLNPENPSMNNYVSLSYSNNVMYLSSTSTITTPNASWIFDLEANDVIRYSGIIQNGNGQILMQYYDDNTNTWQTISASASAYTDGVTPASKTYVNSGHSKVRVIIYASKTIPTGAVNSSYKNVIVTINNSDTTYEPYTGNQPSPSPDYPQEIHSISGDNTLTICGVNLLDSIIQGNLNTSTGQYQVNPNTNFYVSENYIKASGNKIGVSYTSESTGQIVLYEYKNDYTYITFQAYTGKSNLFTLGENTKYVKVRFLGVGTTTTDIENAIVSNNSTATYEPYTSQEYPITLPVENLFDKDNANVLNASISTPANVINSSGNAKTLYISCKPNTTYTISRLAGKRFTVGTTSTTPEINTSVISPIENSTGTSITITTANTSNYLVVYYFLNGTDTLTEQQILDSIQIEKGSKANTYQPYGTTPIEYCKIGDYEDEFIKNSGKNLLNKSTCVDNYALIWTSGALNGETNSIASDYIKVKIGEKYSTTYFAQMMFYDVNKNYLGCLQSGGTTIAKSTGATRKTFTIPNISEIVYMRLGYRSTSENGNANMTTENIMLNLGNTLLDYEPYGSNEWYLKKNIGKLVLDGSVDEDWRLYTSGSTGIKTVFIPENKIPKGASNSLVINGYCDKCLTDTKTNIAYNSANHTGIEIKNLISFWGLIEETVAVWTTYLSNNNLIVYYPLAIPTYILLNNTLQEQLENIYNHTNSYNEQTNVSQENNDLPSLLNATALEEM